MAALAQVLLVAFLWVSRAAAICPLATPMSDFDAAKYLGRWYEMKKIQLSYESGGSCITATYTLAPDGSIIVYNRQYLAAYGLYSSLTGNASLAENAGTEARLEVSFPVTTVVSNYWVLGTDYENYSVVWSCTNDTSSTTQNITAWVLSRQPTLANEYLEIVSSILRTNEVDTSDLVDTDQTACPPVACVECPIVQSNVDTDKMSGEWLEVKHLNTSTGASTLTCTSSYLTTFTYGLTIATTSYNTSSESDILTLDAAAFENSTSKSGSFLLNGDNVDEEDIGTFCILGTDYDNYAVVAECIEHGEGDLDTDEPTTGGVWVWSRTENLTSTQLFEVNKVLVNANYRPSDFVDTASTPCPSTNWSSLEGTTATSTNSASSWQTASALFIVALCTLTINVI